jgi:lysophospholipase L1-like esterase
MNQSLDRFADQPGESASSSEATKAAAAISTKGKLKNVLRKIALTLVSTFIAVSTLVGADLYLHHKHGVNVWGYRGSSVGRKQPGEKRVAVLGGSTAWGFGLAAAQSFPGQLQQRLVERSASPRSSPINVLNLAYNNEGAYSFKYTMKDYDYLDYDVVLIYSGYNDLWQPNLFVFRHQSPIFNWTGYLPLLPALMADRINAWRSRPGKEDKPIVFTTTRADNDSEMRQRLDRLNNPSPPETSYSEWKFYCDQIYEAVDLALKSGRRVLIVTEPYINDKHVIQQRALEQMLAERFAGQSNLRYLNLGHAVDLRDPALCWDGMHLTEEGNRRIADAMMQPIADLLQR